MFDISISELSTVGSELFEDDESFLHELTEDENNKLIGGQVVFSQISLTAGFAVVPKAAVANGNLADFAVAAFDNAAINNNTNAGIKTSILDVY